MDALGYILVCLWLGTALIVWAQTYPSLQKPLIKGPVICRYIRDKRPDVVYSFRSRHIVFL